MLADTSRSNFHYLLDDPLAFLRESRRARRKIPFEVNRDEAVKEKSITGPKDSSKNSRSVVLLPLGGHISLSLLNLLLDLICLAVLLLEQIRGNTLPEFA